MPRNKRSMSRKQVSSPETFKTKSALNIAFPCRENSKERDLLENYSFQNITFAWP